MAGDDPETRMSSMAPSSPAHSCDSSEIVAEGSQDEDDTKETNDDNKAAGQQDVDNSAVVADDRKMATPSESGFSMIRASPGGRLTPSESGFSMARSPRRSPLDADGGT